jgi:hypothetical protein
MSTMWNEPGLFVSVINGLAADELASPLATTPKIIG